MLLNIHCIVMTGGPVVISPPAILFVMTFLWFWFVWSFIITTLAARIWQQDCLITTKLQTRNRGEIWFDQNWQTNSIDQVLYLKINFHQNISSFVWTSLFYASTRTHYRFSMPKQRKLKLRFEPFIHIYIIDIDVI